MSVQPIKIIDRQTKALVSAELVIGMSEAEMIKADAEWRPYRISVEEQLAKNVIAEKNRPESLHWNWAKKAVDLRLLDAVGFGIYCEKQCQGLMITRNSRFVSQLPDTSGKPLVYVDYVESALWNDPKICTSPKFKLIGTRFIEAAIRQSIEDGFGGRIGLHSLPLAEGFYEAGCGINRVRRDPLKENLFYFEMTAEKALSFLING